MSQKKPSLSRLRSKEKEKANNKNKSKERSDGGRTSFPNQNAINTRSNINIRSEEQEKTKNKNKGKERSDGNRSNIHNVSSPSQNTESIQPSTPSTPVSPVTQHTKQNRNLTANVENVRALHGKLPNVRLPSKFSFGNSETPNAVPAVSSPTPEPSHHGRDQAATNPKDDRFITGSLPNVELIMHVVNLITKYITCFFHLENRELKRKISELKQQNDLLNSRNKEVILQVNSVTKENKRLKDENQTLITINEAFGEENDELRAELERYRSFRVPRSLQPSFSLTDESDQYELTKRKKSKKKQRMDEGDSENSESARVCSLN